ncbi:M78 family metallopeptidase domain-containing protein [Anaerocolumna jejuensis]|uniref:hypothetical protein n=1 Tax=Anaerocolumna jejuensis TaxID=259063 RepID=UPI00147AE80B|nr:hypothetical protein [Anaerocolumna jejuensis]
MFAASLLMPKGVVTGAITELKKKGYVSFPELYFIKDKLEVSISALVARINTLIS